MNFRHQARELALKALCQCDALGDWSSSCVKAFFEHFCSEKAEQEASLSAEALSYARDLAQGATANRVRIDGCLAGASDNWDIERMAWVDRNILRCSVYELLHQQHVPWKVCIDEAIELAKSFSGDKSHHFINGILDRLVEDFKAQNLLPDTENKAVSAG